MLVSGFMLREAMKRLELRRDALAQEFKESLFAFAGEAKNKPTEVMAKYCAAEEGIAKLQVAQVQFNATVPVTVAGMRMSLGEAVKLVGANTRVENLWKEATTGERKRNPWDRERGDVRSKEKEYANRTLPIHEGMKELEGTVSHGALLRAAIAEGNTGKIEIDLDPALFK